jgi:uncharacterized protein
MIVFFDASALMRCYFNEPKSAECEALWQSSTRRVGSALLAAEALACFTRKRLNNEDDPLRIESQRRLFLQHWQAMDKIRLMPALLDRLQRIHSIHRLRGGDSLHLAAALVYQESVAEPIIFASADAALCAAARAEQLTVKPD